MMPKLVDRTGQRYGRLLVLERDITNQSRAYWICQCDCGTIKSVRGTHLQMNKILSCGCIQREWASKMGKNLEYSQFGNDFSKTHGYSVGEKPHPTYISWSKMKNRCTNPNHVAYNRYGGRGITICDRWLNSFENFVQDMGERPKGTTLDRINNNGNYEPENCRWATPTEQANNRG